MNRGLRTGIVSVTGLIIGLAMGSHTRTTAGIPDETRSGRPLSSLVSGRDTSLIVVFDPGNVMSCDNLMPLLQLWGRTYPERFALVLTRSPTDVEAFELESRRLVVDAQIGTRQSLLAPWGASPAKLILFVDGMEVLKESYVPNAPSVILNFITQGAASRWPQPATTSTTSS